MSTDRTRPTSDSGAPAPRARLLPVRATPRVPTVPPSLADASALTHAAIAFSALPADFPSAAVETRLEAVRKALNLDAVLVALLDDQGVAVTRVLCARHGDSRIRASVLEGPTAVPLPGLARLVAAGEVALLGDCLGPDSALEAEGAWLCRAGVRAAALSGLPSARGRALGFLAFCCEDPIAWGDAFDAPLKLLAGTLAAGLERGDAEARLERLEELRMLEGAAAFEGVWHFDTTTHQQYFSRRWKEMLGYAPDELNGRLPDWRRLVHPEDLPHVQARFTEHLNGVTPLFESEHRLLHRDGEWRWVRSRAKAGGRAGRPGRLVGVELDVTEQKRLEEHLHLLRESADTVMQSVADAVFRLDGEQRVDYLNPAAEALTGWPLARARGRPVDAMLTLYDEQTGEPLDDPLATALERGRSIRSPRPMLLIRTSDHRERVVESTAAPLREAGGRVVGAVLVLRDLSESRELERLLSYEASHDALTGLCNRQQFEQLAAAALQAAQTTRRSSSLCVVDLDHFKVINDSCGHQAGDALIAQVSGMLKARLTWRDTLSRLGGDEFGVLMEGATLAQGLRAAEALREALQGLRFHWNAQDYRITASIGVVAIDGHTADVPGLLSAGDAACQAAKEAGRNRVRAFDFDDVVLASRRRETHWASRLHSAMDGDRFALHRQRIQPLAASLPDNEAPGEHYELLVRVRDEDDAELSPSRLVGAAERFGMTSRIDRWVVGTAFEWLLDTPDELARLALCSINLSAQSLTDERFLSFLLDRFARTGLPGERFCFEITETAAVVSYEQATVFMTELRRLGCRFALDDFGAGMASFGALRRLPVDFVKIDGSFVRRIDNDPVDRDIVGSINALCQRMGRRTIAEFVETQAIAGVLGDVGVDYAQGYAVGEPRSVEMPLD